MLKLIGSVMIFGSCAALGLNARRELRRRVAAADAMLLALRLMENEITARRTPMPEIIDLLAKNENAVVRQIFSGVRRRMRERQHEREHDDAREQSGAAQNPNTLFIMLNSRLICSTISISTTQSAA